MKWAGFLAHYVQDNTQPHHATEDYQSRSYFPKIKDPKKAPNVHADIEYRMVDDEFNDYADLREEFAAIVCRGAGECGRSRHIARPVDVDGAGGAVQLRRACR
jgi:hypothetical protein